MNIAKNLVKIFVVSVILIAVTIAFISLYMQLFGKRAIEEAVSNMLGSRIKFTGVALDIKKSMVSFQGFTVMNKMEFEENIFMADKFTVSIDREKFEKERQLVFEEIHIDRGTLTIERNAKGLLNLAAWPVYDPPGQAGVAYAAEAPASGGIYNFAKSIKKITISNSVLRFKDYYISREPFSIYADNFNFEFTPTGISREKIGADCSFKLRIPVLNSVNGSAEFSAGMAIYPERVDMEAALYTNYINMALFLPYFDAYTPFSVKDGVFSSDTRFRMHDNMVDSLTTISFHKLHIKAKPGAENSQFLQTSVNRLTPYLMSQQGNLIFDFVIKGPAEKPEAGLGPRVKYAIGMVALEEFSKAMQQLQNLKQ
ncbi:MAG: DUF748 domain-containing protein [Candidatus Omnitrophica bacterium]|nr:DUF748 domain-containing protein [Candidatus Omnitrophota bacterium]